MRENDCSGDSPATPAGGTLQTPSLPFSKTILNKVCELGRSLTNRHTKQKQHMLRLALRHLLIQPFKKRVIRLGITDPLERPVRPTIQSRKDYVLPRFLVSHTMKWKGFTHLPERGHERYPAVLDIWSNTLVDDIGGFFDVRWVCFLPIRGCVGVRVGRRIGVDLLRG